MNLFKNIAYQLELFIMAFQQWTFCGRKTE